MLRTALIVFSIVLAWTALMYVVSLFLRGCEFETDTAKCSCDLEKTLEEARKRAEQENAQQTFEQQNHENK